MAGDLPDTLLRQLSPAQVCWYAVQAGWKPVEGIKRPVIVLNHPTDDLTQLQIPTAGTERERAYLMGDALRQLAEAEKRPVFEVFNDLTALQEAGWLKSESIEPRRERVTGPILSLQAEPRQLYEVFQGRVVIRTLIDGRAARVRFVLKQADFAHACDALRDRHQVTATGILQRDPKAKMFDMVQPQGFQVLGADASVL